MIYGYSSADGMCRIWDLREKDSHLWDGADPSLQSLRLSVLPHSAIAGERCKDVTSVHWSPDGNRLATGCYDGTARIWDARGVLLQLLQLHNGPVFSLKWNRDGTYLLSGSYDKRAVVWDPISAVAMKVFAIHTAPVLDVDWKDNDTFATCSSDK